MAGMTVGVALTKALSALIANIQSQKIITWRDIAFENVCFNHINKIKKALGISGVSTNQSAWSKRDEEETGTQIDMLIERKDNIVNMCEIKFYANEFIVDKNCLLRWQFIVLLLQYMA